MTIILAILLVAACFQTIVYSYTCNDGCVISDDYQSDNFCDCTACEDETAWDCSSCGCPTECGAFVQCQDTAGGTNPNTFDPINGTDPVVNDTTGGSGSGSGDGSGSGSSTATTEDDKHSITLSISDVNTGPILNFTVLYSNGTCGNINDYISTFNCDARCEFYKDGQVINLGFECSDWYQAQDIWKLSFYKIDDMASVTVNIDISPSYAQSWIFDLNNFETSKPSSGKTPSTTTSAFVVEFFWVSIDSQHNQILLGSTYSSDLNTADSQGFFSFDLVLSQNNDDGYDAEQNWGFYGEYSTTWFINSSLTDYKKKTMDITWNNPNSLINFNSYITEGFEGAEPLQIGFICLNCANSTINLVNGTEPEEYGSVGVLTSYWGVYCQDDSSTGVIDSCNGTTFNFADGTGIYYDWTVRESSTNAGSVSQGQFRPYSYYTEELSHGTCQTSRKGAACVADATDLALCCIKESRYKDFENAITLVFGLGAVSCFLGFIGIIGVLYLYVHNIMAKNVAARMKGDKTLIAAKKVNIFRKMEIVTLTCTLLAAVCDILTVVTVINTNLQGKFETLGINGCYNSDASTDFAELASLFYQIQLLGWLEVGFDLFDVLISLFFLNEQYRVNQEIRAQLKEMKKNNSKTTVEMQKNKHNTSDFALDGVQQSGPQGTGPAAKNDANMAVESVSVTPGVPGARVSVVSETGGGAGSPMLDGIDGSIDGHAHGKVKEYLNDKKCPAFVAANVTLFTFDFFVTAANFIVAIYPALTRYFEIEESDRCYVFVNEYE